MATTSDALSTQMDYLNLLVTQLSNQNPLEPLDNNQMATQLAQFSQIELLENMNTSFAEVLETSQRDYASSLIGKTVSYLQEGTDGSVEQVSGTVDGVIKNSDDTLYLSIGEMAIPVDYVLTISQTGSETI